MGGQVPGAGLFRGGGLPVLFSALMMAVLSPCRADRGLRASGTETNTGVDLLELYPTKLVAGDTVPERARPWEFTAADIFQVSHFGFEMGKDLRVETGPADLGIGHCADGAVWAVLIPRQTGEVSSSATNGTEAIEHVWLRFHPKEIDRLFPTGTVFAGGASNLVGRMRAIANGKMHSSWQAGGNAMIPGPKDLTVDVDTQNGPRRFFSVDTEAHTAQYWPAFENQPVRPPPLLTVELAQAAFDQLWEAFDRDYAMFVLRPEVDWAKAREQYRPLALNSRSTYEFANVCADMLKSLRDLHVWLTVAGQNVPVYNRPRSANFNPQAYRAVLGDLNVEGRVAWAVTTNNIGFMAIRMWDDPKIPAICGEVLEKMRNTRGLIVDVRMNGGGNDNLAMKFAGRFVDKEFVYAYSQFRNGASHTNLTEKYERKVTPHGPWRYDRPVVLLIGQKVMSSDESFVSMMTGDPAVTTMGDHTCGSSGNPEIIKLPLEMTVSVPRWIDYLPDGTPLDERGVQPQVPFRPSPGAFEGTRDDLLSAALARLSELPLPEKPIAGPVFEPSTADLPDHDRDIAEEARDPLRPKVVSVTPTNGASAVQPVTELHVRFDRPMDPLLLKLGWECGGFHDCEFPQYDPARYEFHLPIRLVPGALQQIVVNEPTTVYGDLGRDRREFPRDGFQSVDHHLASLFVWRFRTAASPVPSNGPPPRVADISPAPGSRVPSRTFLEIQFDQPMTPPAEAFPFLLTDRDPKAPRMNSHVQYNALSHSFRIPLLLATNENARFTLTGFRSATGIPADPIKLQYRVSSDELAKADRNRVEDDARDPRLLNLLKTMKHGREQLTSLSERVQRLWLGRHEGSFVELLSRSATFKWQKPDQFYGDVTDDMTICSDFRIGSDGQRWWWHSEHALGTNLVVCPAMEMQEKNISLCDPFGLTRETPAIAAADLGLHYAGGTHVGGADYLQVEGWKIHKISWMTPQGSFIQWWIDPENYRPVQTMEFTHSGVLRTKFIYDAVNKPLAGADFAVPRLKGQVPTAPEPLGADYTHRFINLRDGSDGKMSVRWGKKALNGDTSSSGN